MMKRRGFTLTELLVGMVVLAILGMGLAKVYVSQARSYDLQTELRQARYVARTGLNSAMSDLRMVEQTGGVVSATTTSITIRVPYAMGIVCANNSTQTTLALFPVDSSTYANAGFTGYAWRDSTGVYHYVEVATTSGTSVTAAASTACNGTGVTVISGGNVVTIKPPLPSAIPTITVVGSPVFLDQRLTYAFSPSVALPGRTGLFRTIVSTGESDELVAPFASTAGFKFFTAASRTSSSTVPSPLSSITGIELDLEAQSQRAPEGQGAVKTDSLVTAVFFNNTQK
jgi:prepilin-type N-terminal cleavage/methylation domain-containing protein